MLALRAPSFVMLVSQALLVLFENNINRIIVFPTNFSVVRYIFQHSGPFQLHTMSSGHVPRCNSITNQNYARIRSYVVYMPEYMVTFLFKFRKKWLFIISYVFISNGQRRRTPLAVNTARLELLIAQLGVLTVILVVFIYHIRLIHENYRSRGGECWTRSHCLCGIFSYQMIILHPLAGLQRFNYDCCTWSAVMPLQRSKYILKLISVQGPLEYMMYIWCSTYCLHHIGSLFERRLCEI